MTARSHERYAGRMLSTRKAATVLGVHERTVRRYIALGLLPYQRLPGGHYRIAEPEILNLLERGAEGSSGRRAGRHDKSSKRGRVLVAESPPAHTGGTDEPYDLASATLAMLRARTGSRRG